MPFKLTRTMRAALLALSLTPSLTGCGAPRPRLATPPAEWAEPVKAPAIPEGEAPCPGGGKCLSDAQTGTLLADFAAALDEANRRLLKLRDWITTARDSD